MSQEVVLQEILEERARQDCKWGEQNHPALYWLGILVEEVGEVAKAIIERRRYKEELIQTAAVCVGWLEAMARDKGTEEIYDGRGMP